MSEGGSPRRRYLQVFGLLTLLTLLELGVVYVPGIGRGPLLAALVLMALAKAGLVLSQFMHLSTETRGLKLTVLVPFLIPALLAVVLIAEAGWRAVP
jgi:cytochrome c oxidase subunit IV